MVAAALIVLVHLDRVDPIVALIIIGREITISALREWMAQIGQGEERRGLAARQGQDRLADDRDLVLLLWDPLIPGVSTPVLGTVCIWIAAVLTLWSMVYYWQFAAPHLKD